MGYSTPKKPFNLKDFLAEPAPKSLRRRYGYRTAPKPVEKTDAAKAETEATDTDAPNPTET